MTNESPENIALFDMDGTLCNHDLGLFLSLEKLRCPREKPFKGYLNKKTPKYIWNRANLIRENKEWWAKLPRFKLGWDVFEIAKDLGYRIMILTQGPSKVSAAWSGKKEWVNSNLGYDVDMTITRDKGLVYGRVLVDDYPPYIKRWLKWRKNGLVIMPASDSNKKYHNKQVVRYDGINLGEVRYRMESQLVKS